MAVFSDRDLQAIAQIFADPSEGLPETDITEILGTCRIVVEFSSANISQGLFEGLKSQQANDGNRRRVLAFLRVAMDPERHEGNREKFDRLRASLNEQLLLSGIRVNAAGNLEPTNVNFIERLWRGDIPLVTTFWLCALLSVFLRRALSGILETTSPGSLAQIVSSSIVAVCFIFVLVAVWRSAGKYDGPMYWALFARGWVVLGFAVTMFLLAR